MTPDKLPHDPYMRLVGEALAALGYIAPMWTETPDGEQLDAVFEIDDERSGDRFPDGVTLGWDQHDGWQLITNGPARTLYELPLDTYARPEDVAAVVHARLTGMPDPAVIEWDQADEWEAIVTAWEAS